MRYSPMGNKQMSENTDQRHAKQLLDAIGEQADLVNQLIRELGKAEKRFLALRAIATKIGIYDQDEMDETIGRLDFWPAESE